MKRLSWLLVAVVACSSAKKTETAQVPGDDSGVEEDTAINTSGMELVKSLPITEIALFQGPKVTLEKAGARVDARRAPAVVGRPGMLRVYVTPAEGYEPREVVATLTLETGGAQKVLSDKKTPTGPSADDRLDSTFNFELALDMIGPDTTYKVDLKTEPGQTAPGGTEASQYPADGSLEAVSAQGTGEALQVKIVPIQYNADGSGKLPDVSEAQLELYRAGFSKLYPARKVDISVRAPYPFSQPLSRNGTGFSQLLNTMVRLRQTDGAAKGMYYFGAFATKDATFEQWCQYGCVAGLSYLAMNPGDTWTAASVGVGWKGEQTVGTATHEVGHGHGRNHSPCARGGSIDGVDPKYPYAGAALGVWALDIETKGLVSPTKSKDFMAYCEPTFVSDYTFGALATRMKYVYSASYVGTPETFKTFIVDEHGKLEGGDEVTSRDLLGGNSRVVNLSLADGKKVSVTGAYYEHDHLPGGLLVVPVGSAKVSAIEARDLVPGIESKLTLTR